MVRIEDSVFCDGCGVEILWAPVVVEQRHFCCKDCSNGLECDCGSRTELEDERRPASSSGSLGDMLV